MEIIEVNTVMADWFGPFLIVMGIFTALVVIGSIILSVVYDRDWLYWAGAGPAILALIVVIGIAQAYGTVEPEEKVRVQQEVERISGQEVTLEEVDSMLAGDPVRDVYYIRDGYTLIVEKDQV